MLYENLFNPVSYQIPVMLEKMDKGGQGLSCLYHSVILVDKFKFCDRIDWYCILDDKNGEALFFDTGHPTLTGTQLLQEALNQRGISWDATSVFLTHFHVDHSGNLTYCLNNGARSVLFIQPVSYDANSASNFLSWTRSSSVMKNDEQTLEHLDLLNGKNYFTGVDKEKCHTLRKGEVIAVGGYAFEVMPTPGHAPEHACLVDRDKRLFVAGDHLIFAKPGMMQLAPDQHLLSCYMDSLSTIRSFKLETVLMSHHEPLVGNDTIDAFLKSTQEGYWSLLQKAKAHVASLGIVSAYEIAKDSAAHYPEGIDTFPPDVQMRRVALMFGTLEGLYDEGMVKRRQDDDGAYVYFVQGYVW